jgi:hypothetical protein
MKLLSIISALLSLANTLFTWAKNQQLIQAGEDKAVAQAALSILRKTEVGKRNMEKVDAMSDDEVDDALRGLEPGGVQDDRGKR